MRGEPTRIPPSREDLRPAAAARPHRIALAGRAPPFALAALLAATPFAAGGATTAPLPVGCTAGPATLARMQAAAPPGAGATQTPADFAIEDGYSFVMLGVAGTRLWPDKNAKLASLMRAGDRADAICKIKTADGSTSWLVLRTADGILQYVPAVATSSVQAHDADLSRVRKIWAEEEGRGGAATPAAAAAR